MKKIYVTLLVMGAVLFSAGLAMSQEQFGMDSFYIPGSRFPAYNFSFTQRGFHDNSFNTNLYLDEWTKDFDIWFGFGSGNARHKVGGDLLFRNDPVWNTLTGRVKYSMLAEPSRFLRNELLVSCGYQDISSTAMSGFYSAGQFFLGGEENLTGIIGGEKLRLETTGTLGGYESFVNFSQLVWDHYLYGYDLLGVWNPLKFLEVRVWLDQDWTVFNMDKYFFLNSVKETRQGAGIMLYPSFEDIGLNFFVEKVEKRGKELDGEATNIGGAMEFEDIEMVVKVFTSIGPDESSIVLSGAKYLFLGEAMVELFFNSCSANDVNDNLFGMRFTKYFGAPVKKERIKMNLDDYQKREFEIIDEQGYDKPDDDFNMFLEKTNRITEIGNIGLYVTYGRSEGAPKNPLEVWERGYGDCDELAWLHAYTARMNGYENSWFVDYYDMEQDTGHSFFMIQDTDGRVYVTDNDHNVYLRVDVPAGATPEEMSDAAVRQLSPYLAMIIPEGHYYYWMQLEPDVNDVTNYNIVSDLATGWTLFESDAPEYAPIDTGLMTRIGRDYFHGF